MVGLMRSPNLHTRQRHQLPAVDEWFLDINTKRNLLLESNSLANRALPPPRLIDPQGLPYMENQDEGGSANAEDVNRRKASSETATRHKLGRLNSRGWFNKSFDQAALQMPKAPSAGRTIRRQNSVSDFFQHVITKSKLHIQDLFSSRLREKPKHKSTLAKSDEGLKDSEDPTGAEGGTDSKTLTLSDQPSATLHNSCPSFKYEGYGSPGSRWVSPVISFDPNPNAATRERRLSSQSNRSDASSTFQCDEAFSQAYRPIMKSPKYGFSSGCDLLSPKRSGVSPSPSQSASGHSPSVSPIRNRSPKIVALPSFDILGTDGCLFTGSPSSGLGGRSGLRSVSSAFLSAGDETTSRSKRALVKSNSDTFAKLASAPQSLAKASSDGDCFKKSPSSSLATSMSSLGNIMCGVTDYLFLGSIEAAYNEPLLCKYGITSLLDMSNVNPSAIPALKKSDCPCTCVNKTHFRSKLNIGVNDIEWENIEQYFDDINAFIHGARNMGRRVLVFSYLGQSRAPAAVIQHLMQHFRMSYRDALKIVRDKRAQVKLNSGFVKALRRLEKRLNLESVQSEEDSESNRASLTSLEEITPLAVPPVVKGAWLEC